MDGWWVPWAGGGLWLWSVVAAFRAGQSYEREERGAARDVFFKDMADPRSEVRRLVDAADADER